MGDPDSRLVLGRYALLRLLGRGGMGSVYLARVEGAAGFRKPVAIKLIHPHLMDDASAVESFVLEAKLVVQLSHPNIVQVLDFGEHNGQYVMVLEYVHGYDLGVLAGYLRQSGRAMSVNHAALAMYRVLRGLERAHDLRDDHGEPLGLVHRDISPQNILIATDGQIQLTDFGIARIRTNITRSGRSELKGKLAYLSPEQVTNHPIDRRSDLFALGIVLHEVLSGERLFYSENEAQTIMRVSKAEVPDILKLRPDLPAAAGDVLGRALAADPADRYQNAGEFAMDLHRHLLDSTPDEVEPSFQEMVRTTVSEPDFQKQAGGLFDLASDLAGEPLSLPTGPSKKKASDVKDATPTTASPPRSSAGRQLRLFVGLAVGVMLIAALASGAILFGMGPSREGLGEGQGPVKVIVEDRARGAGARDANSGTKKAAGDAAPGQGDGSAAESLMATKADGSPASTAPPRPTVQPLDGRRVTATLLKRRRAILRCFERAGTSKVKNVVIRLEVARNGAVSWAKVEPASEQGTPMGKCLAAVATKTKFPAHRAEALVFRVPLAVTVQ